MPSEQERLAGEAAIQAARRTWTVEYDGSSRPIICGPNFTMFSISRFEAGRWVSFDDEDRICRILVNALNGDK